MEKKQMSWIALSKKEEQKQLLLSSLIVIHNSAPLEAIFQWSHFKPQCGDISFLNMTEKEKNNTTLQSGTIFQNSEEPF